mgnify:CR=1 FL=1
MKHVVILMWNVKDIIKTVITIAILIMLASAVLRLIGLALSIILPVAIFAFVAYVIYILITGKRP